MDDVLNDRLKPGKVARAAMQLTLLGWACCAAPVCADEVGVPATLDAIVVTGKKIQEAVPDAEVKQRVETAMRTDQFFMTTMSPSRSRMASLHCTESFSMTGICEPQDASPSEFPA
jgi:hypothetical protein